jgi:hypothetical protein
MRGLLDVHEKLAGRPALDGGAGAAARLAAGVGPCEGGLRHEVRRVPKTTATPALPTDRRALAIAVRLDSSREIVREIDRSWRRSGRCNGLLPGLPPRVPENGSAGPNPGYAIATN